MELVLNGKKFRPHFQYEGKCMPNAMNAFGMYGADMRQACRAEAARLGCLYHPVYFKSTCPVCGQKVKVKISLSSGGAMLRVRVVE